MYEPITEAGDMPWVMRANCACKARSKVEAVLMSGVPSVGSAGEQGSGLAFMGLL
jgi:hypothetical protein